jgi:hypothetical protein
MGVKENLTYSSDPRNSITSAIIPINECILLIQKKDRSQVNSTDINECFPLHCSYIFKFLKDIEKGDGDWNQDPASTASETPPTLVSVCVYQLIRVPALQSCLLIAP